MTIIIPGVHFAIYDLLTWLLIGVIAGFFAGIVVRGRGYGCLGNTIVGLIGAVIGGYIASVLDLGGVYHFWGSLLIAFLGACILVFILQALKSNQRK